MSVLGFRLCYFRVLSHFFYLSFSYSGMPPPVRCWNCLRYGTMMEIRAMYDGTACSATPVQHQLLIVVVATPYCVNSRRDELFGSAASRQHFTTSNYHVVNRPLLHDSVGKSPKVGRAKRANPPPPWPPAGGNLSRARRRRHRGTPLKAMPEKKTLFGFIFTQEKRNKYLTEIPIKLQQPQKRLPFTQEKCKHHKY